MRSEQEIKELIEELSKLTAFIADLGSPSEFENKDVTFGCDVSDTLSWVVGEIADEHFRSDAYLNLESLRQIALRIEERTGNKFADYDSPEGKDKQ